MAEASTSVMGQRTLLGWTVRDSIVDTIGYCVSFPRVALLPLTPVRRTYGHCGHTRPFHPASRMK